MSADLPTGAGIPLPGAGSWQTVNFPVTGMTCGSCASRITRALKRLDGVDGVHVDLGRERVTLRRDPSIASDEALAEAIVASGYVADLTASVPAPGADLRSPLVRLLGRKRGNR